MDIEYKVLEPHDSRDYRRVRLTSLRCHPGCFGSNFEEQVRLDKLYFEKLIEEGSYDHFMIGAFDGCELIGFDNYLGSCSVKFICSQNL